MDFGTYPTGWHIEGDLPNQVAVSTGSTVHNYQESAEQVKLIFTIEPYKIYHLACMYFDPIQDTSMLTLLTIAVIE